MQKFLSFLIFHKAPEILTGIKFHQVHFVRSFDRVFNEGILCRPQAEEETTVVPGNDRKGDRLKLVEDLFLAFFYVNELCDDKSLVPFFAVRLAQIRKEPRKPLTA